MTAHTAHPSSAMLAAFVDGRLSGKELSQLVEHLGSCTECFEVVAETAEIQEELEDEAASAQESLPDNVVVHPRAWKRWAPAAALVAAVLSLVVVGAWQMGWLFGNPLDVDRLAGRLQDSAKDLSSQDWAAHGFPVLLGVTDTIEAKKASFRAGVFVLDLQTALLVGERTQAESSVQQAIEEVQEFPAASQLADQLEVSVLDLIERGEPLPAIARNVAALDPSFLSLTSEPYYELGKWSEAGRLAALAKDSSFLKAHAYRASIDDFLTVDLHPDVTRQLREIQARLQGDLDHQDLDELTRAYRSIVAGEGVRLR